MKLDFTAIKAKETEIEAKRSQERRENVSALIVLLFLFKIGKTFEDLLLVCADMFTDADVADYRKATDAKARIAFVNGKLSEKMRKHMHPRVIDHIWEKTRDRGFPRFGSSVDAVLPLAEKVAEEVLRFSDEDISALPDYRKLNEERKKWAQKPVRVLEPQKPTPAPTPAPIAPTPAPEPMPVTLADRIPELAGVHEQLKKDEDRKAAYNEKRRKARAEKKEKHAE